MQLPSPISLTDPQIPARLFDLQNPPAQLWISGQLPEAPFVAIVGTRRASQPGLRFAEDLAYALSLQSVSVLSGGALGIDSAAHLGALSGTDIGGTPTVAVLGTGLRSAYPAEHASLFEKIASTGAIVSEYEDAPAQPGRFLARNRIVAALASAVVVVEAPFRSGALATARIARRLGRPVLAVPGATDSNLHSGCHALLRDGARICTGAGDVLQALRSESATAPPTVPRLRRKPSPPSPAAADTIDAGSIEGQMLTLLRQGPMTEDALFHSIPATFGALTFALFHLEVRGAVRRKRDRLEMC